MTKGTESLTDSLRTECEDLFDIVTDALGCIEIGRGDREYENAKKALRRLREILGMDE